MKELKTLLTILCLALVAAFALAAVVAGRSAVLARYEYQRMVAPRTLHVMVLEMEAAEEQDDSASPLFGAGLLALVGAAVGGGIMLLRHGSEFQRQRRLGQRRPRQLAQPQAMRILPTAPPAPPLLSDRNNENYANEQR